MKVVKIAIATLLLGGLGYLGINNQRVNQERIKNENNEKTELLHKVDSLTKLYKKEKSLKDSVYIELQKETMSCMIELQKARKYIGTPYKWGGTSHSGIDCSGLVCVAAAKKVSKRLFSLRTAQSMWNSLMPVKKAKKGILVFFKFNSKKVSHVGIVLGKDSFIHSSTSQGVKIDNLSKFKATIVGYRRA